MAQQLTVKAYLKRWNVERKQPELQDEIRRFSVDQDVATSYAYLLAKVTSVFPGLNNKSITLYWRDVDNDMIAFSSDDELMEAVKNVNDGILRVFIHEKPSAAPSAPEPLHFGVTCDGCEGAVCGIRYKCMTCPDYDLCSVCKATGLHSEHEMTVIEHPLQMFHGPFVGNIAGFPPCVPPPPPPAPPVFEGRCCDPAEMRRMNRRAFKRWYKETYGDDHKCKLKKEKKEKERQEKKRKKEAKKQEKMENGKDQSTPGPEKSSSDSSSSSESEGDQSPGTEYLRSVGHSVAAMLDPLGIDVEVDVEAHGQRRRCHRGPPRGFGGPWWHGMRGGWCGPWGMRGGGRGRFGCTLRGHGFPPPQCRPGPRATAASAPQPQPMDNSDTPASRRQDADTNAETGEMASGPHEATAAATDHGWTLVNDGIADVEGATTGVEQLHVVADSAAADPAIPAADGRIETAVEQMMSMGYSNDGGWLTHLLIAHQGDIGRALDAIHANK